MYIKHIATKDLAEIVAGLVRQGVQFTAVQENDGWTIELTGGY